jgi:hypothetical protein
MLRSPALDGSRPCPRRTFRYYVQRVGDTLGSLMSRILTAVLVLMASVFALAGLPDDASAQKRLAFVVGTDKYDNLDKTRQLQRAVTSDSVPSRN